MPVEEWVRKEATRELVADEYEVDAIVAEKLDRKKRTFLVKWKVRPRAIIPDANPCCLLHLKKAFVESQYTCFTTVQHVRNCCSPSPCNRASSAGARARFSWHASVGEIGRSNPGSRLP